MGKRFKSLEAALKYLRTPGAAGTGGTPPSAPAGTQLAEYQEYRSGKKVITYTRSAESKPGQIDEVRILPFAEASTSTALVFVGISKRASQQLSAVGLSAVKLGHRSSGDAGEARGFTPARAIVSVAGTTETATNSKITGRTYSKKAKNTYSFPVGQGEAALVSWKAVKAEILTAVSTGAANRSVTFKSEISK